MRDYEIALFLHILGVVGLFSGLAVTMACLLSIKRAASVGSVRVWAPTAKFAGQMIPMSALVIFLSGIYLVQKSKSWDEAWTMMALALLIVFTASGFLINAERSKAIFQAAFRSADGPVPPTLSKLIHDPVLAVSENISTAAAIGLVYLMVAKPGTAETIVAMVIAVAVGVLLSWPDIGVQRAGQQSGGTLSSEPDAPPVQTD